MYGWIPNIIEKFILSGIDGDNSWQAVKLAANCEVPDDSWIFSEPYPDEWTFNLLSAASNILKVSEEELLEALGGHLIRYSRYH
jgi:hypothetical protein